MKIERANFTEQVRRKDEAVCGGSRFKVVQKGWVVVCLDPQPDFQLKKDILHFCWFLNKKGQDKMMRE